MKLVIIGAGWYGLHLAIHLKSKGHELIVVEKNAEILSGISGKFGIRLHTGPHYPRSKATRDSCHEGYDQFIKQYSDLLVNHSTSVYGLGDIDADGFPSKVDKQTFESVTNEFHKVGHIDPNEFGYKNLISAVAMDEPSIVLNQRLKSAFQRYIASNNLDVRCNFVVEKLERTQAGMQVVGREHQIACDYVINATNFQTLLPERPYPFGINVVYQSCLALIYEDLQPDSAQPFSFIVTDGWFPCIMPYIGGEGPINKYILTHGKWTLMGSHQTPEEANALLANLDDQFIEDNIKVHCEASIQRFWPAFQTRFAYQGWTGSVIAKINTAHEFRSALTFMNDRTIYVLSGKVSNIFDAEREVDMLLNQQELLNDGTYTYVESGILASSLGELLAPIGGDARGTCSLQTYQELANQRGLDTPTRSTTPLPCKDTDSPSNIALQTHETLGRTRSPGGKSASPIRSPFWEGTQPFKAGSPAPTTVSTSPAIPAH